MKVVCVYKYTFNKFTYGRTYETIDGVDDFGFGFDYITLLDDFNKINYVLSKNFIPISEMRDRKIDDVLYGI